MKDKMYIKLGVYAICVALLVALDQWTKWLAVLFLKGKQPIPIIEGVFELHYLQNDGAAWGMLSGRQNWFIVLTVAMLVVLVYVMAKTAVNKHYMPICVVLVLISAGAVGNFIDRLLNGYVTDFLYFKLINFPIFNVADMYVTISMILMVVLILFFYKDGDFAYLKPDWKRHDGKDKH